MRPFFASALAAALGVAVAGAIVLAGEPATAKASYDSAYGFDRTWNAALRLVRVDMGLKVTEKDDATGYLLFEYRSSEGGSKTTSGSMEFIRARESEAPVRVVVQLPSMPRYHEQIMVDALVRKMRQEYGEPPPRRPTAPPKDGGADASTETEG
jgi:hypothetical protein